MTQNPKASDWAAERGEKWRAHLAGMEAMLAPVDGPLIRALDLAGPCRIADVGCGGGGTTRAIARHAPPGSAVHGFDISPALVAAARAGLQEASSDGNNGRDGGEVAFACADVATAPAPAVPYDRLVSRFGIMFYDDPPTAFANLVHWLAPGGRVAFAVWGPPAENPWIATIREVVAAAVALPATDPEAPGPFRYAEIDRLCDLLTAAGLDAPGVHGWHGTLPIGGGLDAAEAAHFALASFSLGERVASADADTQAAVHRALAARFAGHLRGGAVHMGASVHIVTGRRKASADASRDPI